MAYRHRQGSQIRQTPPPRQPQKSRPAQAKARPAQTKTRRRPPQPPSGGLFSAKLVIAVFFVFVFVYIGHSIWVFMTPDVNTMIVRMDTIETPRSIPGVIIRDEQLHLASSAGYVQFQVQENERVSARTPVASILNDPTSVQTAMGYLSGVESLAASTQARRPASGTTDSGVQRLNNDLTNIVNGRINSFTTLNLNEIYTLRYTLSTRISARNQINAGSAIAAREPLAREYERHMAVLEASVRNMYAGGSGIMSRHIDGHETHLTLEMINELTRDDIRGIADYGILAPASEVLEGDPLFKIVGNVWYIASYMPNDMVQTFTEGAVRTVYLYNASTGSYEPHSLRIERIEYGTRYSIVVFRNTRHVIEFMDQRNISIRTTSGIRRGLKIPDTAIVTNYHYRIPEGSIHGETEKYVLLSTAEADDIKIPVTVDDYTDYYSYISVDYGLTVGDMLVPRDPVYGRHVLLTDAHLRVRHGVYIVDFGRVVFRTIDLGDDVVGDGYVFLDPSLNQGISEFNNIITDASTVVVGQIIR